MKRIHLIISGHVQGVGFRYFCLEQAQHLGISGFARNMPDGSVEVEAQGPKEKLDQFALAVSRGPRKAEVTNIEHEERTLLFPEPEFRVL